ncbi:MAG TPA: YetF domain-containing protein [Symbiobacteriaceae bacterium]|nr:YetF domain-containing protein [Symbiobacteriaceae bacterium]
MVEWLIRHTMPYLLLVVLVRWLVRPRFGKRGVVEIFLVNAVGDLVAHAAFEEQHPMIPGLGGIVLWLVFAAVTGYIISRNHKARTWLGYYEQPVEIVRDGVADSETMHKYRVSMVELASELRKQGITDLEQVESVMVEPDGAMAILKRDRNAQDLRQVLDELKALRTEVERLRLAASERPE